MNFDSRGLSRLVQQRHREISPADALGSIGHPRGTFLFGVVAYAASNGDNKITSLRRNDVTRSEGSPPSTFYCKRERRNQVEANSECRRSADEHNKWVSISIALRPAMVDEKLSVTCVRTILETKMSASS